MTELLISSDVKARFVKDHCLPIQVVTESYFSYFLELYDGQFDSLRKYELLKKVCAESHTAVFDKSDAIKCAVIREIKKTRFYNLFSKDDMSKYQRKLVGKPIDLYRPEHAGKRFASIDMISANFNSLALYDPSLVHYKETYEDMISIFTDSAYFRTSKRFRQVVFGDKEMYPNKQATIQKNYMAEVLTFLLGKCADNALYVLSADELIVDLGTASDELCRWINCLTDHFPLLAVKRFYLRSIGNNFYVKEYDGGHIDFKNVPVYFFAQAFKHYYNMPLDEKDLVFFFEGNVASFKEALSWEIS